MKKTTLGIIIGTRGFFPTHLCDSGRKEILKALADEGIEAVVLGTEETPFGSVETLQDAEKCAALFKKHTDKIDGILVTLPNFGDERGVANTIRWSGLNVPVLVHAFADTAHRMTVEHRRDSFCGKMSVCNNLAQYGVPFSLTTLHCVDPANDRFREDLRKFAATCRVVRGLDGVRLGMLGARPAAFNTVRFSEKLLEESKISVETLDLFEAFGRTDRLKDDDARVKAKLEEITSYVPTAGVPPAALTKMAKFGVVVQDWMRESRLSATAIQCWTAMEEFFGIVPCAVMSMMTNVLQPSACETDITGVIGMLALQLASGAPSALVDWNNNYGSDPDKAVVFHCSNLPKSLFETAKMDYQAIIAGTVGAENAYGTVVGRLRPGPFTYCRVSTDDSLGMVRAYVGEGKLTNDPLDTFGGYGVVDVPDLQGLLRHICENGYEHHVAINVSLVADAIAEALGNYMGWDVYQHEG
ncbi:MAG: L-fucose/L-arabinose isomerase family protein [Armatimonadota bacterium]|nr:L-fucose/L-arabinose isomerase family protein [Armatimonadota bacterium]